MNLIVRDNNYIGYDIDPQYLEDLRRIADCRLDNLTDSYDNELWLFPRVGDRDTDKIEDQTIISIIGNRFTTGNIMGFVGTGNLELTIGSRFSVEGKSDWFMQYMLQKVFAINIFNLKHGKGTDNAVVPYRAAAGTALRSGVFHAVGRVILSANRRSDG